MDGRDISAEAGPRMDFVQEPQEYNRYMSHPWCSKFPIPLWEVSNDMLAELRDTFVIGEERTEAEVEQLLIKSMDDNLDSISRHEGYTFKVPKAARQYMEYNEALGFSLLRSKHDINRTFNSGTTRGTATKMAWTTQKILSNIASGMTMTKRDLMYEKKDLFNSNQKESDQIITDLCATHRCRMPALRVLAVKKGAVLGNIALKLKSGAVLNCSEGCEIPNDIRKIEYVTVLDGYPQICYILVVEKHTMQLYLEQMNFHNKHNCIIMTGSGMPGLSTRQFLKLLKTITKLPVYGLCDPDPSGVEILAAYARGSIESAYDNINLAVPTLRWVGVFTSDIEHLEFKSKVSYQDFKEEDNVKFKSLLNLETMKLSEGWLKEIRHMQAYGKKLSFEELKQLGCSYFAHEMLPKLIKRASS